MLAFLAADALEDVWVVEGVVKVDLLLGGDLGCNSIDIFVVQESGPSHVWSFETYLNSKCPSTEFGPEPGPVLCLVLRPKFIVSIELSPSSRGTPN